MKRSRQESVSRILVTRLRFLGDIILSTPLLESLRGEFPQAQIEYLCEERFAPVLEGNPHLDRIHVLKEGEGIPALVQLMRQLQQPRIDWWFDLFSNPRSVLLMALARPRHSVGSRRGLRTKLFEFQRDRPSPQCSAIRHHMDKLHPLMGEVEERRPHLYLREMEIASIRKQISCLAGESPILLHPGSSWPDKAWPWENWMPLIDRFLESSLSPLCILSPPGEEKKLESLRSGLDGRVQVLPVLPIRELMALLSCSRLYIGNDGGILHAAVALDIPSVGLFGPTDPRIWFPYEKKGPFRVLRKYNAQGECECGQSHVSSLAHIGVEEVFRTVLDLLSGSAQAGES